MGIVKLPGRLVGEGFALWPLALFLHVAHNFWLKDLYSILLLLKCEGKPALESEAIRKALTIHVTHVTFFP